MSKIKDRMAEIVFGAPKQEYDTPKTTKNIVNDAMFKAPVKEKIEDIYKREADRILKEFIEKNKRN